MARIPDAELARLKRDADLVALVRAKGVVLKPHGKDLLGLCPFHDDHEPSLVVTPSKNLWHCLGACKQGGSPIDWLMKAEGVSFRHAVELLRAGDPAQVATPGPPVKRTSVPRLPNPVAPDAADQDLLAQVVAYYHQTLKDSPEALDYLKHRALDHPDAIDRFQLGYCNRTLGYRIPARNRADGARIRERLAKLGILRKSGHEHFRGSLVIPIHAPHGPILGLYGRKIRSDLTPGTPKHLYLPGPRRGIFNEDALAATDEVILCESLIDALTFWCAGFPHVTASYGIEGFTADHLAAFRRHRIRRVLIAYDRDDAGEAAAADLARQLMEAGIACAQVLFPRGMDPNDYARKVPPAARSLDALLRSAVWLGGEEPPPPESAAEPVDPWPSIVEPQDPLAADDLPEDPQDPGQTLGKALGKTLAPEPPPVPSLAAAPSPAVPDPDELPFQFAERRWRVRGLSKNTGYEVLKVNLLVAAGPRFHVDRFDLYAARPRAAFLAQAACELAIPEDTLKQDLGRILLKLEDLQDAALQRTLEPAPAAPPMTEEARQAALELLGDPRLTDRVVEDLEACGLVGESTNKLVAYLATISRKLDDPLAVVIQSSSSAGKTTLMDAVLALVPGEDRVKYSAVTGQALFYLGQTDLAHKVLAIVEEAGAARAGYALKLLQSEGELTIASTGKDPATGRLVTQEYRVEGPVMIVLTTTALDVDEELANRALVLSVSEERPQTAAIHRLQRARETLAGQLARQDRARIAQVHQDAQRLLRPRVVANPYARDLTFLDDRTRSRRDHAKYLTLIRTIAFLHQHQRPVKTTEHQGTTVEYIEVTPADIALANRLCHQVLGRSLDELAPQTRRFLDALVVLVEDLARTQDVPRPQVRFTRRHARQAAGTSDTQARLHLERLVALEYLLVHRGARGVGYLYELLYDQEGADGAPFCMGLLEVEALPAAPTTGNLAAPDPHFADPSRGVRAPFAAGSRGTSRPGNPHSPAGLEPIASETPVNASRDHEPQERPVDAGRSRRPSSLAALAAGLPSAP